MLQMERITPDNHSAPFPLPPRGGGLGPYSRLLLLPSPWTGDPGLDLPLMIPTEMNTWGSAWPMAPVIQHSCARYLPSTVLDTGYLQTGFASSIFPKDLKCRQVFTWELGKNKLKELVLGLPWALVSRIKPCSLSSSPESLANGSQDTVLPLSAYFNGKICTVLGVRTLATKELDHPTASQSSFPLCS